MAAVHVDTHIPIEPGGHVKLLIDIRDVASMSEPDREFILILVDKLSAWTPPSSDDRAATPAVPAVLRGVGGRA